MVSSTDPQKKQNNHDDQLWYEIAMNDACIGKNDSWWPAEQLLPDNNEYEVSSLKGNCNFCIGCQPRRMDSGFGCDRFVRCADFNGGIPHYRRKGYTAPKDECCYEPGRKTVGNKTCDPKFRRGPYASDCEDVYLNNCNNANDIFQQKCVDFCDNGRSDKCKNMLNKFCTGKILSDGNSTCTNWCDKNPELCNTRVRDFCVGSNIDKQYCKDKLVKIGYADGAVNQWCMTHANDPFCGCFNALLDIEQIKEPEIKKVLSRVECYNSKCSSGGGYKYTNMRDNKECPPVNVCVNELTTGNISLSSLHNITQDCNQTTDVNAPSAPSAPSMSAQPTTSNNLNKTSYASTDDETKNYDTSLGPVTEALSDLLKKRIDFFGEFTVELLLLIFIALILLLGITISLDDSSDTFDLQKSSLFNNSETLT